MICPAFTATARSAIVVITSYSIHYTKLYEDYRTYNIDPIKLEEAIQKVNAEGKYKAKAILAVDLFGQPADYDAIIPICEKYNLLLLA